MQPRELEHAKSDELIQSASSLKISFGFKGKRPSRNSLAGSNDEILDSLTRHAKLMEEDGKDRILGLQTVLEVETAGNTAHSTNTILQGYEKEQQQANIQTDATINREAER